MTTAITPGTFDPITSGHLDIISRTSLLFDEVIVAVAKSDKKKPVFSLEERVELAKRATASLPNVKVMPFDCLLVDFARQTGSSVLVKGLRAITDFEYEFQMTALNYKLDKDIETIFVMSPPEYMYLSSSIVREVAGLHGDITGLVPQCIQEDIERKFE